MTKKLLPLKCVLAMLALVLSCAGLQAVTLFENFDSPSAASTNNGALVTYTSGDWYSYGITKPSTPTESDRINGVYSILMRG